MQLAKINSKPIDWREKSVRPVVISPLFAIPDFKLGRLGDASRVDSPRENKVEKKRERKKKKKGKPHVSRFLYTSL
jgi:hypothetical protein